MKLNIGVGLVVLLVAACTPEASKYEGKSATNKSADAALCDNPDLYGADCSGEHPNGEGSNVASADQQPADDKVADEKPAEEKKADTPAATPPAAPKDPNIVEFRIAAGTAAKGWNTADKPIVAKVGQTIRFFNDDTVNHRLHTGGQPCPHGANIAPGASMDCKTTAALTTSATGTPQTYDHIAGTSAPVFLNVTP